MPKLPEKRYALSSDQWLSAYLGKPSWRVDLADRGDESLVQLKGCFAFARVPVTEVAEVRQLMVEGFYPVDVALTFEGRLPAGPFSQHIRFAVAKDRESVARVAETSFRFSRFHLDAAIPVETANRIKADWAANFFAGARGDAMVVAELDGQIVGFLQLLVREQILIIDLIGVMSGFRGRGIAREMIHFAAANVGRDRAVGALRVGTQAANIPSVRLYESLGLRLAAAQYVLHYHGS